MNTRKFRITPILLALSTLLIPLNPDYARSSDIISSGNDDLVLWKEPFTGAEFVWIPAGCFMMGQSTGEKEELLQEAGLEKYKKFYADELPRHQVCLDGFWMSRRETTVNQWKKVMDEKSLPVQKNSGRPINRVSWEDANIFIQALGPLSSANFRLPTEAEWERAARAGKEDSFNTGRTISTEQANYNGYYVYGSGIKGTYLETPLPTGTFKPNDFGLFDMHGNVWEWCSDWYDEKYYNTSPKDNPIGPDRGELKVMRGGSWFTAPRSLRSANRRGIKPTAKADDQGFRLVAIRSPLKKQEVFFDQDF